MKCKCMRLQVHDVSARAEMGTRESLATSGTPFYSRALSPVNRAGWPAFEDVFTRLNVLPARRAPGLLSRRWIASQREVLRFGIFSPSHFLAQTANPPNPNPPNPNHPNHHPPKPPHHHPAHNARKNDSVADGLARFNFRKRFVAFLAAASVARAYRQRSSFLTSDDTQAHQRAPTKTRRKN